MEENELLLSLIKDHIIHSRLLGGLSTIGFETESFCLNLSDTIFKLAALNDDEDDSRYSYYLTMADRINFFEADKWLEQVEPLAKEILEEILGWQEEDLKRVLPFIEYF